MRRLPIVFLILLSNIIIAQTSVEMDSLNPEEYNISHILLSEFPISYEDREIQRAEPVGYFGKNYQRFFIHFISVIQNPARKSEYLIYGKNKLKGKISKFQGILKIETLEIFKEESDEGLKEGIIKGTYQFFEDPKESGNGIFEGVFKSYIMLQNDQINYNTVYWYADGFENNQFEGTWVSYKSQTSYVCNWSDYRVPNRRGFDKGAGQMSVASSYIENGWENFQLANFPVATSEKHRKQIEAAKKKEAEEWWK